MGHVHGEKHPTFVLFETYNLNVTPTLNKVNWMLHDSSYMLFIHDVLALGTCIPLFSSCILCSLTPNTSQKGMTALKWNIHLHPKVRAHKLPWLKFLPFDGNLICLHLDFLFQYYNLFDCDVGIVERSITDETIILKWARRAWDNRFLAFVFHSQMEVALW